MRAYKIPTDSPMESDGTLEWTSTTLVTVEVRSGVSAGLGYTYANSGAGAIVQDLLREKLVGKDAMQTGALWNEMYCAVRNNSRRGLSAMALSAVDIALWDLKGKLMQTSVCDIIGTARNSAMIYGSGGFTSYSERELAGQLSKWASGGIPRVKMKVGREPDKDAARVKTARKAIGKDAGLFVDANGAYGREQAIEMARQFAEERVIWFEEPVDHDDLQGNAYVRQRIPAGMEVSNGEYGWVLRDFSDIVDADAADVLQADVTRCGGYTGFLAVDAMCQAKRLPLSSHCAPYVTLPAALCAKNLRHIEYFHDHVRIERMLFDGTEDHVDGHLTYDRSRPGIGLELKTKEAEEYRI